MATVQTSMTAEEFFRLPENDRPLELIEGEILEINMPGFRHGKVCAAIASVIGRFVDEADVGHIVTNDSGIVTRRNPDSVRGADVAFYSYERLPKEKEPAGYPTVAPELVFEVLSPDDHWPKMLAKAGEHLEAGVCVVCLVDPKTQVVNVVHADQPTRELTGDDALSLPALFGDDFDVPMRRFFES
jgi:Uma2 family endonuclease